MDQEKVEFTVNVLTNALYAHQNRMRRGLQLRQQIHEQIAQTGQAPDHYRVAWMEESVRRVFRLLNDMAGEFNDAHPEDRCSSQDIGDILSSALATLREHQSDD